MAGNTTQLSTIHVCRRDAVIARRELLSDWFRPLGSQERRGRLFLRQVAGTSAGDPESRDQEVGRLLTVAEASERLRISRWMLQQLINRRRLRSIKLGSRRLIPERAISELVDRLSAEEAQQ
jgi:excisionase family DNA binding protein